MKIGMIIDGTIKSRSLCNGSNSVRKYDLIEYNDEYSIPRPRGTINMLLPGKQGLINGNHMDNHEKFCGLTNGNGMIDVADFKDEYDQEIRTGYPDTDNIIDDISPNSRFSGFPSLCAIRSLITGRKIKVGSILLVTLLVAGSILLLVKPDSEDRIIIDGDFSDWNSILGCPDPTNPDLDPSLDIIQVKMSPFDHYISFFLQTRGNILRGIGTHGETIRIFIDHDHDPGTGYSMTGLGADILIELYGLESTILSSTSYAYDIAYRSEGIRNNHDWNAWAPLYDVHGEIQDNRMEVQIWLDDTTAGEVIIPTCMIQTMGNSEDTDISPVFSQAGSLEVQVQSLLSTNSIDRIQEIPLLKLKIRPIGGKGIIINSISFSLYPSLNGTIIKSSSLHCDASAVEYNASIEYDRLFFTTEEDLTDSVVSEWSYTLRITLTRTVITGQTLHIGLSEMDTAAGITPINSQNAFAYITAPPDSPIIDGLFNEWGDPSEDPRYDCSDPSVDLRNFDTIRSGDEYFFYARTDEEIIQGMTIPLRAPITLPSQNLVDHHGQYDLPADDIQNFLPESRDMDTLYIFIQSGDPGGGFENDQSDDLNNSSENRRGDDSNRNDEINNGSENRGRDERNDGDRKSNDDENGGIDERNDGDGKSNDDENGGIDERNESDEMNGDEKNIIDNHAYYLGSDFQADYLIEIKGRNGDIISKKLLRFTGISSMDWNWSYISSPRVWITDCQLETSVTFQGDIRCLFHLVSWNEENTDTSDEILDNQGVPEIINGTIRIRSSKTGVCINEIMPNPELESNEWVELFNPKDTTINISSWFLRDESGIIWTGETGDIIASKNHFNISISNKLKNSGETLTLFNDGEEQSDQVTYPTFTSYEGFSYSRIIDGGFYFERDPTPSRNLSNSINESVKINEIYYDVTGNEPSGEFIELYNKGNETLNISGWMLRNDQRVTFDFNAELSSQDFFIVESTDTDLDGQSYQDCFGQYGLGGDQDFVVLENPAGQTVDRVTYSSIESSDYFNDTGQSVGYADSAPDVSEGNSLGRYPDGIDTDNDTTDFSECVVSKEDSNIQILEKITTPIIILFIIIIIHMKQRMKSKDRKPRILR